MTAADDLRAFIAPLLDGWRIQFGRWTGDNPESRFAVIQPTGGLPSDLLRTPTFTLHLIGAVGEPEADVATVAESVVAAIAAMGGTETFFTAGEPAIVPTTDGRPIFDIAISAIAD